MLVQRVHYLVLRQAEELLLAPFERNKNMVRNALKELYLEWHDISVDLYRLKQISVNSDTSKPIDSKKEQEE